MRNITTITLKKFGCILLISTGICFFAAKSGMCIPGPVLTGPGKEASPKTAADKEAPKADNATSQESKEKEAQIANAISVTTEQLVAKPQEYLNKDVKFTAKFSSFNSLALDYKPAFRSSRTYISFLVFRPDTHIPFSELKLAMLIPKEKDPETHMLGTLKEGDTLEVYGRVFACPLDEPWLDVIKIKKIASSPATGRVAEDKAETGDKDTDEDSPTENKHE